jgi:leucyl-tRNA synthetase
LWYQFYKGDQFIITDEKASPEALKSLHKLIKKVTGDIETFSYNTSVSAFMICVNELSAMKCHSKEIYQELIVLLTPFAPHISEELWHAMGNESTVCDAKWPKWNEEYLKESKVTYAVSFNGKTRFTIEVDADMPREELEKEALANPIAQKWMEGKTPRKIIVVPKKIINVVI